MSRERFSTQVEATVAARTRATVAGVRRVTGEDLTLAEFVEEALAAHCARLEVQHHEGQPWPTLARLRPGRRVETGYVSDLRD